MKKFTLILFTLVLTIGIWIPSCDRVPDCNCGTVARFVDIEGLALDNLNNNNFLLVGETSPWEDYQLYLRFFGRFYGNVEQSYWPSFSLMPKAMACTCVEAGSWGSEELLKEIHITSLFDYDGQHLKGDTLDDLFRIELVSDDDGLSKLWRLDSINGMQHRITQKDILLRLISPPTLNDSLQIEVSVELENGEKYFGQNEYVILTQ